MSDKHSDVATDDNRGHEPAEIRVRTTVLWGAAYVGLVGVALILTAWLFGFLRSESLRHETPQRQAVGVQEAAAGPRVFTNQSSQLERLREDEDRQLSTYGWVDRRIGIVHVPIDRAMELLVEHGLPAPKSRPSDKSDKISGDATNGPTNGEKQ
jgi:hypothetical protein